MLVFNTLVNKRFEQSCGRYSYLSRAADFTTIHDFDTLMENLTDWQLDEVERAIMMYERNEIKDVSTAYETRFIYADTGEEYPYTEILKWYEGLTETSDLIAWINEVIY